MSIKESALNAITSITQSDFIRAVTAAGASRRVTVANLAKAIIESYTGSSLAGGNQSVKSALDALNSKIKTKPISGTFDSDGEISFDIGGDHTPIGLISISRTGWRYMFSYAGSGAWSIAFVSKTGTPATGTLTATVLYI